MAIQDFIPAPGERRLLTILFADVVGSTMLAESLDPEDWTGIMYLTQRYSAVLR